MFYLFEVELIDIFTCFQLLESLLPKRQSVTIPRGENTEEVNLHEYEPSANSAHHGDHHHGGPGGHFHDGEEGGPSVQCANQ